MRGPRDRTREPCRSGGLIAAALMALSLSACISNLDAQLVPGANLAEIHNVYVVDGDNPDLAKDIAQAFQAKGLTATSGPREDMPEATDTVATFVDRWMWDFSMYLMKLTITVSEKGTEVPLATATSERSSMSRVDPDEMAREVVDAILSAKKGGS